MRSGGQVSSYSLIMFSFSSTFRGGVSWQAFAKSARRLRNTQLSNIEEILGSIRRKKANINTRFFEHFLSYWIMVGLVIVEKKDVIGLHLWVIQKKFLDPFVK